MAKNYQCKLCGITVQKDSQPSSSGCPKGSSHSWYNLGEVGSNTYQCKQCGTSIKSASSPSSSGCPSGSSHSWYKL